MTLISFMTYSYLAILKTVAYEMLPAAPVTTILLGWLEEVDMVLVAMGAKVLSDWNDLESISFFLMDQ